MIFGYYLIPLILTGNDAVRCVDTNISFGNKYSVNDFYCVTSSFCTYIMDRQLVNMFFIIPLSSVQKMLQETMLITVKPVILSCLTRQSVSILLREFVSFPIIPPINGTGDVIKSNMSSDNDGTNIDDHLYGFSKDSKAKAHADTSSLLSPIINTDLSSKSNISTFIRFGNFKRRISRIAPNSSDICGSGKE